VCVYYISRLRQLFAFTSHRKLKEKRRKDESGSRKGKASSFPKLISPFRSLKLALALNEAEEKEIDNFEGHLQGLRANSAVCR
jgi:hypothetical protein